MDKRKIIAALVLALAMTAAQAGPVTAAEETAASDGQSLIPTASDMLEGNEYKPDELIVTFDESVSDKKIKKIVKSNDASVEQVIEGASEEKLVQVSIPEEQTMYDTIQKFQQDSRVADVQPNYRYKIQAADPYLDKNSKFYQYVNEAIHAEEAWTFLETEGNKKATTKVAVLDTGVDVGHEDLKKNLELVDGKYYMQLLGGEEIKARDDSGSHGTHVAGIIGATYGNGKGGSGAASGHNNDLVNVMMVGTSPDGQNLYTLDVVNAVKYAVKNGAKVINMSFGMNARDRVEEKVLMDAYYNDGLVLVAASGNEDFDGYSAPGSMKEVIGVNASAEDNSKAYYSNYGYSSDITAPGSNVMSTVPGDKYARYGGTSMASPVVAAVAALMLDANPELTPQQVYNILCATTGSDSFDKDGYAYGLVNASEAVQTAARTDGTAAVESLSLKEEEAGVTILEGDDYGLEALVRPAEAMPAYTWESSDPNVATVDENGRIIGITAGSCQITVRAGEFSKSCTVTVKPAIKAESIKVKVDPANGEIAVGEILALTTSIKPEKASNLELYYESSDIKVAQVDEMGFVTGISPGTAKITVYTYETPADYLKGDDPSVKKISADVTVTVKSAATKVSISGGTKWMWVGDKMQFSGKLSDFDGHSGKQIAHNLILWSVNKSGLASIDKKGLLTAKKAGTVYVIATQDLGEALTAEEGGPPVKATRKLIIAKKQYKGKRDYALKAVSKKKKKNRVTLKWKVNPIASGYQIQFASKKKGKFKTIRTIKSGTTKSVTIKTKKTGYYRIRASYVLKGKTKWFGYSNVVKGKPYTKKKK